MTGAAHLRTVLRLILILMLRMRPSSTIFAFCWLALTGCSFGGAPFVETPIEPAQDAPLVRQDVGVLVMAHGGDPAWNEGVAASVAELRDRVPTALAYGMANPHTLRAALDSLHDQGVSRVAVVRMFLSGRSFLDQSRYLLGLSDRPPEAFVLMGRESGDEDPRPIPHEVEIATHPDGLMTSRQASVIMAERAVELSVDPASESVLMVAHGMGADDENAEVEHAMRVAADVVAGDGYARVEVATLREDWEDEREKAERTIRTFVAEEGRQGRSVIVLPFRLFGFGPYAEVLDGLDYRASRGLLPHPEIATWVEDTAARVACSAGWGAVIGPCATAIASPAERRW